eukprot:scaffold124604_cov37-Prasinocladus_malaysianus.AAC.3
MILLLEGKQRQPLLQKPLKILLVANNAAGLAAAPPLLPLHVLIGRGRRDWPYMKLTAGTADGGPTEHRPANQNASLERRLIRAKPVSTKNGYLFSAQKH